MRLLGLTLDDVKKGDLINTVYEFLDNHKGKLKLVLYNYEVEDIEVAEFVKKHETKLTRLNTKITRDVSETCYFFICESKDRSPSYTIKFSGDIKTGLKKLEELLESSDARKRHIRKAPQSSYSRK